MLTPNKKPDKLPVHNFLKSLRHPRSQRNTPAPNLREAGTCRKRQDMSIVYLRQIHLDAAYQHQVTNNNVMFLEKSKARGGRPLRGTVQRENLKLTLKQILRKALQQTSPNSEFKVTQEEFGALVH